MSKAKSTNGKKMKPKREIRRLVREELKGNDRLRQFEQSLELQRATLEALRKL
jgi:hypothetical protein